jgi:hypothetical protein
MLGMGFSGLRQIALTFCHSNVIRRLNKIYARYSSCLA